MDSDQQAAALSDRMVGQSLGILEGASIWLGARLGWYAALRDGGPATAAELAERAGTQLRYTREWAEQQAVAGILTLDGDRFALPPGHATALLDRDSPLWTEPFLRQMLVAVRQLPAVARAARDGGGVPWEAYGPEMSEAQGDCNAPALRRSLPREWVPQVPGLVDRLAAGARVADLGCGEGWSSVGLAEHYPAVTVDGYDTDPHALERARAAASWAGVADRVSFRQADAAAGLAGPYDVVLAIECVHDMAHPVEVLAAARAAAAPDALVLVVDEAAAPSLVAPGDELQRLFYGFSLAICLPDSLSHPGTAATGAVMRPSTLDAYAREAGFAAAVPYDFDAALWRFYRLEL